MCANYLVQLPQKAFNGLTVEILWHKKLIPGVFIQLNSIYTLSSWIKWKVYAQTFTLLAQSQKPENQWTPPDLVTDSIDVNFTIKVLLKQQLHISLNRLISIYHFYASLSCI